MSWASPCEWCTSTSAGKCSVCELRACNAHGLKCGTCNDDVCVFCTRLLPFDKTRYCLNCFDKKIGAANQDEIVAGCLPKKMFPEPDEKYFLCFDPPIETMTYSWSRGARDRGERPDGVQAEHFIPNSCFIKASGRNGETVAQVGGYTEGSALTFWVADDQKSGTEHKYLTDRERAFSAYCVAKKFHPTLGQWLTAMQATNAESLVLHRDYICAGANGPNHDTNATFAAQQAAYALRCQMQDHFERNLNASSNALLAHGVVQIDSSKKAPKKGEVTKMMF
jgi:hypothetical protein